LGIIGMVKGQGEWGYDTPVAPVDRPAWLEKVVVVQEPLWEDTAKTQLKPRIKALQEAGFSVLAMYPQYFGGISLNKPAVAPGDPSVSKGLKVRVPPIKSFQLTGNAMGYISAPLPFSEAFTAVQTGVVDGVIGSGAEGYYASFRDVTKNYIAANTHFEVWYLMIGTEKLESLKPAERNALKKAAADFETQRWAKAEADQAVNEKKLEEAGAKIIRLTPQELAATAALVRKTVWPEIVKDVGESFAKPILDKVAN